MGKEKIVEIVTQFRSEIILILISLMLILCSFAFYSFVSSPKVEKQAVTPAPSPRSFVEDKSWIYIDLEGAVERPMVYKILQGSRIYELLEKGILSKDADKGYVSKNINRSELLVDQEKIYVPSVEEVSVNTIPDLLTFANVQESKAGAATPTNQVNINLATQTELEALPGIGAATATKIINNRPYDQITDLLSNKILGQSIYEKIISQISVE